VGVFTVLSLLKGAIPILISSFAYSAKDILKKVLKGFSALVKVIYYRAFKVNKRESLGKYIY
jgi:hypothetical protein